MKSLTISSCQAPNMDVLCDHLASYISDKIAIPVQVRTDIPWQERDRLLDQGLIDLCWICGLPYVRKVDQSRPKVELLAAPVMQGERYQNLPIYYSDVVVRRDSPFMTLPDLHGASWAYNEPNSHSGYNVVRYALAARGENSRLFGRVIESGAHQTSLQMILQGKVDASAIDSTVLELEMLKDPSIRSQIRVIDTFGPSPIPPWVVSLHLPAGWRERLKELFIRMDQDPAGRALLEKNRMLRFAAAADADYEPIREMTRIGEGVLLGGK